MFTQVLDRVCSLFSKERLSYGFFIVSSIINALIICIIATRFLFSVNEWTLGQYAYYYIFTFGNFFLIGVLLTSLLIYPLALLNCKKIAISLTIAINTLLLIFIVADTFVFQMYRLHINLSMMQMVLLGGGQVVQLTPIMYFQIAFISFVLLLLSCANAVCSLLLIKKKLNLPFVTGAIVVSFLAVNCIYAYAFPINMFKIIGIHDYIPLDRPIRMTSLMIKTGLLSQEEIDKAIEARVETPQGTLVYPLAPIQCPSVSKSEKLNIVFIYVDALRYDVLNKKNMPNLYEFGQKNVRFENHYSAGNNTGRSVFSLFYGLPASYWNMALASQTPSALITTLQQLGYYLGVFASAPLTNPEFHATIFASVKSLRTNSKGNSVLERDQSAVSDFINWHKTVVKEGVPYFSFVFLDNVHGYTFPDQSEYKKFNPYWKEINHLELNNNFNPEKYFNRYKNAVLYADYQIQQILNQLKEHNSLDNTIVMISSDHGENFNDQKLNYWGHGGNFTDSEVKVPLVIHWPGKEAHQVHYMTSSLDIISTVLRDALKCSNPTSDYSVGLSLWETEGRRNWVFTHGYANVGFIEKDRIIVVNKLGGLSYYDKGYQPLENEVPPSYLGDAIKDMSRFY